MKALVSKTSVLETVPEVRILLPPPSYMRFLKNSYVQLFLLLILAVFIGAGFPRPAPWSLSWGFPFEYSYHATEGVVQPGQAGLSSSFSGLTLFVDIAIVLCILFLVRLFLIRLLKK